MRVVVYEPDYNEKHREVLRALAEGIPGAVVRPVTEYEPCDVAVIFGAVKQSFRATWSKREILKRHSGRSLLMVESAFVRRGQYWQVGWGGYAGHADFRTDGVPPDRWDALGIEVKPWADRDGPFVVCGQLARDTQVQDVDHRKWCRETVAYFRRKGCKVRFRPHPKEPNPDSYGVPRDFISRQSLAEDLAEARCFVTWNSTSSVDAVIAGVPVIACDPGSMARPMAVHELRKFRDLVYPDRAQWLAGLGYSQWMIEEMRGGLTWRHLTR